MNLGQVIFMPIWATVPSESLVSEGTHQARIVQVSQPESHRFAENRQAIKLTCEITQGAFRGSQLTKWLTFTLWSTSTLGQLVRKLLKLSDLKTGQRVDLEELIGQETDIDVVHKDGDQGKYAAIKNVAGITSEDVEPHSKE